MKRMLALFLAVLLLGGCAYTQLPDETDATTVPTASTAPTVTTEPPVPGLYDSEHIVEQQTAGAVRAYPLDGACDGLLLMGQRLLLYYFGEQTRINAYTGDDLTLETTVSHDLQIPADGKEVQVSERGLSYYNRGTNTLVVLNAQLREKYRVSLPMEIQGIPVVNGQMDTAYYCTSEGIRAMDLETGIAHMLRQQEHYTGAMVQQCFDGSMLVCSVTNGDGTASVDFISTETGRHAGKDRDLNWVDTEGDAFFLNRTADGRTMYLFGTRDGALNEFAPMEQTLEVLSVLELGGVLTISNGDDGAVLDFYHLETGLRTASVTLAGMEGIRCVTPDSRGYVWFLDDQNVLYRWEIAKSSVTDETVYTRPWYSSDTPNAEGLARCQDDADTIGEKYGITVRIWESAVDAPWDGLAAEHRVTVYDTVLPGLDATLALFPEGFLEDLGSICDSGAVSISLVADTTGETGRQEWFDGNAYIAVEVGDDIRAEILRTLYRVMDTYILGKNSMLDEWDADKPAEDRAALFVTAMAPDQGVFFESNTVQSQLRTLCRAIRDAFGLKHYESELPWEQYLNEPLY